MIQSPIAIVIDPNDADRQATQRALEEAGFVSTALTSFQEARGLLMSIAPDIVVADVRLGEYNGLHLAVLCSIWRPGAPFIVTDTTFDPVLEAEAKRCGAAYVVKSATQDELKRTALAFMGSRVDATLVRRYRRKPAPMATLAKIAASEARVIDISYDGVRLKLAERPPTASRQDSPITFDVMFPKLNLSLHASQVWESVQESHRGGWQCGADLSQNDSGDLQRWRDFVDSVS